MKFTQIDLCKLWKAGQTTGVIDHPHNADITLAITPTQRTSPTFQEMMIYSTGSVVTYQDRDDKTHLSSSNIVYCKRSISGTEKSNWTTSLN
jgi:hypothetical protein